MSTDTREQLLIDRAALYEEYFRLQRRVRELEKAALAAPAAPAAPGIDVERLAKALAIAEINCWANPVRHEAMDADEDRQHRLDAEALVRAYARLANPEKP